MLKAYSVFGNEVSYVCFRLCGCRNAWTSLRNIVEGTEKLQNSIA